MARLALSYGGAIIGGIIGYYVPGVGVGTGAQIGFALGSLAGAIFFPPTGPDVSGPRIKDLEFQASQYGAPIPIIWGTFRLGGNIIWATDIVEVVTIEETGGGKGGGGGGERTTYTYFSNFTSMVCVGPISSIRRIWGNKKLMYDTTQDGTSKFIDNITIYLGTDTQTPDPTMEAEEGAGLVPAYRDRVLVVFNLLPLIDFGNQIPQIEIEVQSSASPTTLKDIVDRISDFVDVPPECRDTSALSTQVVRGFAAGRVAPARSFIDTLRRSFFFDASESEGKLNFTFRGADAVVSLVERDLGASDSKTNAPLMIDERVQEVDLPESVALTYIDFDRDFQENTATARRSQVSTPTVNELVAEMPIVFIPSEAEIIAQQTMYLTWISRVGYKWSTLIEHLELDPTDVVNITVNGIQHKIFITNIKVGANNVLEFEGISEDVEAHVIEDNIAFPSNENFGQQFIEIPGDITLSIIDVAILRGEIDDSFLVYASTTGEHFSGATIFTSTDNVNYSLTAKISTEGIIGTTNNALIDYQCFGAWDERNSIDVNIPEGKTLINATKSDVYLIRNIALIGDEIIGYRNATLIDTNLYRLSGLLRGMQGTDWAANSHSPGERFIELKLNGSVVIVEQLQSSLGGTVFYKAVKFGGDLEDTTEISVTFNSNNLRPLSPSHVRGSWDGSDNLTITWVRRARIDAGWEDSIDVPLDEFSERYEIDVYTEDGVTFLRRITDVSSVNGTVITPLSQSANYDNVDQTADGITAGDPVMVKVYQMSSRVGRGFVKVRVLTDASFTSLPNQSIIIPSVFMVFSTTLPIVIST